MSKASQSVASALPAYAELFCLSNFSFLDGASTAEELVARAVELGYAALAITDECSLAGVVRAHAAAKQAGLSLLIGAHFHLRHADGSAALSFVALAQNRNGYGNLCELITLARTRSAKGAYLLMPDDLAAPPAAMRYLQGLPDCQLIMLPAYALDPDHLEAADADAAWMRATFGARAHIGLTRLHRLHDAMHGAAVEALGLRHGLPVVALGDVCMHVRSRKPLHDTLSAIRIGKAVADCGYALEQNAERHLRSRLRLSNLYPAHALQAGVAIAALCDFSLDQLRYEYPQEVIPAGHSASSYLRQETYAGARLRFPRGLSPKLERQLETELGLIEELRYEAYFLTVYDIVRYARSQNILCQGRGSAANSAVCYCLGITAIDPERSTLLFGRFISRERAEPPDIDVDFEHQRREEVMQYIYRKYGRDRAALAAAVATYRPRSALRDSGKALGVDLSLVDKVCKAHRWFDGKADLLNRLAECGLDPGTRLARQWAALAQQLLGFPRHLSQHSGGFVIAQGKLSRLVPIENAAMPDRSVIQWDKDDLEELGLLKVDVLALGMLSALRRTLDLVSKVRGKPFALDDIADKDEATFDMMCAADTIGVFQIESRAQMSMLPRLRPRCFYDLVIEVALVRPGPIQGGMVHPYLQRRQDPDNVAYPNPDMKIALGRTLGIPIFQEQVMQVVMLAAGFSAGDADQLRRSMASWKRKGGLGHYYQRIVDGMDRRGYAREFAEAIFRQIQGFGEYGFPESHAASFALLVYDSAWLKCHEPAAFLCAQLNSQPMGFYSPSQLVQDARRHKVVVREVDVAISDWEANLEDVEAGVPTPPHAQPAVRLGLSLIRGMNQEAALRIAQARAAQPFIDVDDLARRAQLERADLQALAAANALASLAGHRRQALWQAVGAAPSRDLLRPTVPVEAAPQLAAPGEGDDILGDYRALGLTLQRHPLALLRPNLLERRFLPAAGLFDYKNGQFARGAGLVTVRQRPGTAKGVLFMTLEDETGSLNVIVWPALFEQQRREALNARLLGVYGIWQCERGVRHLIAKRLVDLTPLLGRLPTSSRDFS